MRHGVIGVLAILGAAACSLNPQPLPPDNPEAGGYNAGGPPPSSDAGTVGRADGSFPVAVDAGMPEPPPMPGTDGGEDGAATAPDAGESDGATDASDGGAVDAPAADAADDGGAIDSAVD